MKKLLPIIVALLVVICGLCMLTACGETQNNSSDSEHFPGNCQTKGYTRYYLSNGSYYDVADKEFGDHVYSSENLTAATCTADGSREYTCTLCEHKYSETVPATGHSYQPTSTTATCTQSGSTVYTCANCGDSYSADTAKLEHSPDTAYVRDGNGHKLMCKYGCGIILEQGAHSYGDGETLKTAKCDEKGEVKYTCTRCEYSYVDETPMTPHSYSADTVRPDLACGQNGKKISTCDACGDVKEEAVDPLPHSADGKLSFDEDCHWLVCAYGCGTKLQISAHTFTDTPIPAICIEKSHIMHECDDCGYSYKDVDENSEFSSHLYEAYTCMYCQRDMMLDYIDVFTTAGTSASDKIMIENEQMLVMLLDYITLNHISRDNRKYFYLSYKTDLSHDKTAENYVMNYLNNVLNMTTGTNWGIRTMIPEVTPLTYISAFSNDSNDYTLIATHTPDDEDYPNGLVDQYYSFQFENYPNTRSGDFDDFACYNRLYEMSVLTSDDLFFAFEHGYKPAAVEGSVAETILNEAKAVARKIIDDSMTDTEKVRAIYLWLVQEVQYDHGIVASKPKTWSYYSSYYLEGVFLYNIAVCDGISKAFCVLAGLENIKCVRVTSDDHAWNKVLLDINGDGQKQWYSTDATWGNQKHTVNLSGNKSTFEKLSVDDFLFTDTEKAAKGQAANSYNGVGCDAVTTVNPYANFYFGEAADSTCDYVIESLDEMKALFAYIASCVADCKDNATAIITVDIFITSEYCTEKTNISNAINGAYTRYPNGYKASHSASESKMGEVDGFAVVLYITLK